MKLELSDLLELANQALERAVAPYSNFPVGAVLECQSGGVHSGCNIENSSYGLTICAERVAMFKALSEGEREFTRMVITAKTREWCPPCGACRQVLYEHAPNLKIILLNSLGKTKETTIGELLPQAFGKEFLENR